MIGGAGVRISIYNRNDAAFEAAFDALMLESFGLSFAPWNALKLWDERYERYVIEDGGAILSSVCVFKARLVIGGRPFAAHQLGGVATRPDRRGQGLSQRLMRHVLARYPETPMFLFANRSVLGFYPRFGFRRVFESAPSAAVAIDGAAPAERLSPRDGAVRAALLRRGARSRLLSCLNSDTVELFHLLLAYADDIYRLADGTLCVARREGETLSVADIVSERPVSFGALLPLLPFSGVRRAEFGFSPDHLGVACDWTPIRDDDEAMFVRGEWPLPARFKFPALSVT